MLRALAEAGVAPDMVLGTSIGAVNGALFADDPSVEGVDRLSKLWRGADSSGVLGFSLLGQISTLVRSRTHMQSIEPLRTRLEQVITARRIEDLAVSFQCVAASVERAAEHWFDAGPIAEAVLASSAVPGVLPAVEIDGEHFMDGGLVNSIPVARAVALGAATIFVLQVGRLEKPLQAPRWPWEVGLVAFEVARRHRFAHDLSSLPAEVELHVLPTGGSAAPAYNDISGQLRVKRIVGSVQRQIDTAYRSSMRYLEAH